MKPRQHPRPPSPLPRHPKLPTLAATLPRVRASSPQSMRARTAHSPSASAGTHSSEGTLHARDQLRETTYGSPNCSWSRPAAVAMANCWRDITLRFDVAGLRFQQCLNATFAKKPDLCALLVSVSTPRAALRLALCRACCQAHYINRCDFSSNQSSPIEICLHRHRPHCGWRI